MKPMSLLAALTLSTLIGSAAQAQSAADQPTRSAERDESVERSEPAPRISFSRTDHDFGSILDTAKKTTTFEFTNTGKSPLEISDVRSSCGCTVPELPKTIYAPGETGTLTVVFDPENRHGPQHRAVRVATNDPANQLAQLHIRAHVKPAIEISPRAAQFGSVKPGSTQAVMIDVVTRVEGVRVHSPSVGYGEGFTVEMVRNGEQVEIDGEPARRSSLMVTLSDKAPLGRVSGRIMLRVIDQNGEQGIRSIPVTGQVIGDLRVAPTRVNIGFVSPGETYDRRMRIASVSKKKFTILGIEEAPIESPNGIKRKPALRNITWEATPVSEDTDHAYDLRLRGTVPEGLERIYTRVIIKTDREDESRIPVYLTGRVRQAGAARTGSPTPRVRPRTEPRQVSSGDGEAGGDK